MRVVCCLLCAPGFAAAALSLLCRVCLPDGLDLTPLLPGLTAFTALQQILTEHNDSEPLFLYYAPHIVHYPLSVPEAWYDK